MTCFIPVASQDVVPISMLRPRPFTINLPVIKMPRSVRRRYSDSELSTAAMMLEKLRKKEREMPVQLDQDRVLDAVVEKLIERLEE